MGPVGRAGSKGALLALALAMLLSFPLWSVGPFCASDAVLGTGLPSPSVEYDDRIYIEGNSDFIASNGASSGTGTESDPYIIEDRDISAFHGKGISIRNTTSHFVVRNCTVVNGSDNKTYQHDGIELFNSWNGRIEGCRLMNNRRNIYATVVTNFEFLNNEVNRSLGDCIHIYQGNHLNISGNVVWMADERGINIGNIEGADLMRNEVHGSYVGLMIWWCKGISARGNYIHDNDIMGLDLTGSSNITFHDNVLRSNLGWAGISVSSCSKVNVSENRVILSPKGINLADNNSLPISIYGNTISECQNIGIVICVDGAEVQRNRVLNNFSSTGILLSMTANAKMVQNEVRDGLVGICDTLGDSNLISGNRVEYSEVGIYLDSVNELVVKDNQVTYPEKGIRLFSLYGNGGFYNKIENNTVDKASNSGISLGDSCYRNSISSNLVRDCHTAIHYQTSVGGDHNDFHGNILQGYFSTGIYLDRDRYGSVRSNTFNGSNLALVMDDCSSTEVIDNRLMDTGLLFNGNNKDIRWNIDRTPGTNIMGGPFLMGNYWSDYEGIDINGDGIGDTDLPYGPGDLGPLIKDPVLDPDTVPPWVEDRTKSHPKTSATFVNDYIAHDDRPLLDLTVYIQVEYLCSSTGGWSVLKRSYQDAGPGNEVRVQVDVPQNALELSVRIDLEDFTGNNASTYFNYSVMDNMDPELFLVQNDESTRTGSKFRVEFYLFDNCGFSQTQIGYDQNLLGSETFTSPPVSEETTNQWDDGVGLCSIFEIVVPEHYRSLRFWPIAQDHYGNELTHTEWIVPVKDWTYPEVGIVPGQALLSGKRNTLVFDATDNWEVSGADLDIWVDDDAPRDAGDPEFRPGTLTFDFDLNKESITLFYHLSVWDTSSNIAYLQGSLNVTDGIPPNIKDISPYEPRTGMEHEIRFSIWDNQGLSGTFVSWWCDSSGETNVTDPKEGVYIRAIPVDALILNYKVGARDLQGNWNIVTFHRPVIDVTEPSVFIDEGQPETDNDFFFRVRSVDNREVSGLTVLCFSEPDGLPYDPATIQPGLYKVFIPGTMTQIRVRATATDGTGNEATSERTMLVKDSTPPRITGSGILKKGGRGVLEFHLSATDNRGISTAMVRIMDGNRTLERIELNILGEGNYGCTKKVGHERFGYFFEVTDQEGNTASTVMEEYRSSDDGGPGPLWAYILPPLVAIFLISSLSVLFFTVKRRSKVKGSPVSSGQSCPAGPFMPEADPQPHKAGLIHGISARGRELVQKPGQRFQEKRALAEEGRMALTNELERERFALMAEEGKRITERYLGRRS